MRFGFRIILRINLKEFFYLFFIKIVVVVLVKYFLDNKVVGYVGSVLFLENFIFGKNMCEKC